MNGPALTISTSSLAAGCGRDHRLGGRGGGRQRGRGPAGGGAAGGALYDGARVGAAVGARAPELGVAFAALAVELGGEPTRPVAGAGRFGLAAISAAFDAADMLPGWLAVGVWRFASSVSGGRLIAANTTSPYLMVGKRRFMPPVPPLPA